MIRAKNVYRRFGDFTAVKDVSFDIPQGEIVGLLGHNGAGKTTLMKMITGYLEPSAGDISIDGHPVKGGSLMGQNLIGYLPESLPLYPEMTIVDYLDYVASLRGNPVAERGRQIQQVIAKTELGDKAFQPIATLSRGYRQRVGVAQALLNDPKILILDEPTNGLDPAQTEHMRELIKTLGKQATVILSTHIMREVHAMCDRVIMVRQGELALDAKLSELADSNRLCLITNATEQQLEALLKPLQEIDTFTLQHTDAGRCEYLLTACTPNTKGEASEAVGKTVERTIAAVSKAVVRGGFDLFGIQTERYDLETVFRDINEGRSVPGAKGDYAHAA